MIQSNKTGWLILDLKNFRYDGCYSDKKDAEKVREWYIEEIKDPSMVVITEYYGIASDLEPHWEFIAEALGLRS